MIAAAPVAGQPGAAVGAGRGGLQRRAGGDRRHRPLHLGGVRRQPAARPDAERLDRAAVGHPDHRGPLHVHGEGDGLLRADGHPEPERDRRGRAAGHQRDGEHSTVAQGGTLGYTITVTNTAASAYSGVTFSAPLSNVLADAVYNNNAAATAGTVDGVAGRR